MAQTNYTPISLYYSTTASAVPTAANLVQGELAINTNDGKLYYEDSSGVVRVLASKSTGSIGGSTTQVQYNNAGSLAGSANFVFDGTNVGIGVTPSAQFSGIKSLQIGSTTNLFDNTTSTKFYHNAYTATSGNETYLTTGYAQGYLMTSNGQHQWYIAASGTAGNTFSFTQAMTLDASGNVGIGATSPVAKLHVKGSGTSGQVSASFILENSSSGTGGMDITGSAGASRWRFLYGGGPSTGTNALTEAMCILTEGAGAGNVGIGTTSMGRKLNIAAPTAAGIQFQSTGTGARNFSVFATDSNASVQSSFAIFDDTASAYRFTIDSSGIVTMPAYGAGAATFSASGVISSVSDETWKTKDGVPVNTDAMLQKLEPGYWFYNEEKAPTFGQERQLGFYAQNVHEAIGEEAAPTPQEGKPWGYHDRSVLAIAVMSLKNALNTIEELKQRITVLENK
jgi:hypothetical protein